MGKWIKTADAKKLKYFKAVVRLDLHIYS
jgi:hypothetical protein